MFMYSCVWAYYINSTEGDMGIVSEENERACVCMSAPHSIKIPLEQNAKHISLNGQVMMLMMTI